jgi:HEAT repeat protein
MPIKLKVITGTRIVALLTLCSWSQGAQQQTAPTAPSPVTQSNPDSTGASAFPKSGTAPPAAPTVTANAAELSPAAATRKAWKCLNDGLAEKNYDRRTQTIAALGTIGLRRTAVLLVERELNDKDAPVRQAAAEVLGTMKSRSSIPKLRVALDDNSTTVRFSVAQALWTLGDRSGQNLFLEVLQGDSKVTPGLVRGELQQIHEEMHDPKALAELGSEEAAGALLGPAGFGLTAVIELTKDKASPARAISARMLADGTSDGAREGLRDALHDKSWIVRAAAAEAIGFHGSVNDIKVLAPLLDDQEKKVRYRAAASIIRCTLRRAL